jgi:hypothetical protein
MSEIIKYRDNKAQDEVEFGFASPNATEAQIKQAKDSAVFMFKSGFDACLGLELPVLFMNWTLEGDCTHSCTDEDQWTPNEYSIDNRLDSITTAELYQIWINTIYK